MPQHEAITFQYNDSTKTVKIFDHNNTNNANSSCLIPGVAVLSMTGYPNASCTTTITTVPMAGGAVPAADLLDGVPSGVTSSLGDTTSLTALSGGVINITFQSDGTVVDALGNYVNRAMFLYNRQAAKETAAALSVLGAAGRVKVWRYNASANQ